jgi:hypothetical protein
MAPTILPLDGSVDTERLEAVYLQSDLCLSNSAEPSAAGGSNGQGIQKSPPA